MSFDASSEGEGKRDEIVTKRYYVQRASLASGLEIVLLSESPVELCDRLLLEIEDRRSCNDTKRFYVIFFAIFGKL